MICHRCFRHALRQWTTSRSFSQTTKSRATPVSTQVTTNTNPRPNDLPAATSTSAAQPLSTPLTSSAEKQDLPIQPNQKKTLVPRLPQSSVLAGTPLKGLNFRKNVQDPVALEDAEYPAWLWGVLETKTTQDDKSGLEVDLFAKSKKQRQRAAKALRKQLLLNPEGLAPKIPLHEQTIDLPDQGPKAGEARAELTKSMRQNRRSKIKEDNFLRAMR